MRLMRLLRPMRRGWCDALCYMMMRPTARSPNVGQPLDGDRPRCDDWVRSASPWGSGPGALSHEESTHATRRRPPGYGPPGMPGYGRPEPGPTAGRYTVASSGGSTVLVDTATGKTWVLQQPAGGGPPVWLPAERIDDPAEAQKWRERNSAQK